MSNSSNNSNSTAAVMAAVRDEASLREALASAVHAVNVSTDEVLRNTVNLFLTITEDRGESVGDAEQEVAFFYGECGGTMPKGEYLNNLRGLVWLGDLADKLKGLSTAKIIASARNASVEQQSELRKRIKAQRKPITAVKMRELKAECLDAQRAAKGGTTGVILDELGVDQNVVDDAISDLVEPVELAVDMDLVFEMLSRATEGQLAANADRLLHWAEAAQAVRSAEIKAGA